jgi:hypothetical protein
VPPRGGNELHNTCAKNIPGNVFSGSDVLVNGKAFDGLQATRTLWEIKTGEVERYKDFILLMDVADQVDELTRQQRLAWACGYRFAVGVRSATLKKALEEAAPTLRESVIVMWWC